MFKKIKELLHEKWKAKWWLKEASNIAGQYESERKSLEKQLSEGLKTMESEWAHRKELLQKRLSLEEESVSYRIKNLADRELELIKADNDLKIQIRTIEAKASLSSVWAEAFSMGVSKTWDMLLPIMSENVDKLKSKMKEDAIHEAIGRLHATNKK